MKRTIVVLLALVLVFSIAMTACSKGEETIEPKPEKTAAKEEGSVAKTTEPEVKDDLTENRPTLKFLVYNRPYDPNEDMAQIQMMDISGYKVEYLMLPSSNGDEKLMLEMSSGTEYDLVELPTTMFGKLADMGVLTPLDDILADYGNYILPAVTDLAWDASKNADGQIVGLPRQKGDCLGEAFGARSSKFYVTQQEILDELSLEIPTDLESFSTFLKAIKDAKGVAPLTGNMVFQQDLMAAFGLPNLMWIEDENGFKNIIETPELREYIRYMASLYKDELLDADFPINKIENIDQKFTSDLAYVSQYAFWDIPRLLPALEANGFSKDLVTFKTPFVSDDGTYPLVNTYGINIYYGIPKSSTVPEHAINYMNILSEPENFKQSHIGIEGVHYEVKDDRYFPLLPKFSELNWANQFLGMQERNVEFKQWQARARKTPEMAVAYDEINSSLKADNLFFDRSTFTFGLPAVQEHTQALNTLVNDFLMKSIVEDKTSDADFDELYARWKAEGGEDVKAAMNEWAAANPLDK